MIVGAVVLAAGKSERMGRNKLLMVVKGKKLIDNILDALAAAGISDQAIVLGHKAEEMLDVLKPRLNTIKTVVNMDYEQGMASSFQAGLRSLMSLDAVFLVLGDEPILDPEVLRVMIRRMEEGNGEVLIVSPIHEGKKGHPLLFHNRLFQEILDLKNSQTLREVVRRHADSLITVESPQWTVMDVDNPEDYERVTNLLKTSKTS